MAANSGHDSGEREMILGFVTESLQIAADGSPAFVNQRPKNESHPSLPTGVAF